MKILQGQIIAKVTPCNKRCIFKCDTIWQPKPTENESEQRTQLSFVPLNFVPKRQKSPLGPCGNPVTFLSSHPKKYRIEQKPALVT